MSARRAQRNPKKEENEQIGWAGGADFAFKACFLPFCRSQFCEMNCWITAAVSMMCKHVFLRPKLQPKLQEYHNAANKTRLTG